MNKFTAVFQKTQAYLIILAELTLILIITLVQINFS